MKYNVGNWVLVSGTVTPKKLTAYDLVAIEEYMADFEPIPLTPEILAKAGFVKWNSEIHEIKIGSSFLGIYHKLGKAYFIGESMPCQYVHQLQNLYFALTGEELIFEL